MKPYSRNQLKRYRWKGINHRGKLVSGYTLALNDHEVRERLSEQSIRLKTLRKRSLSVLTRLTQKINRKDITLFTRQLSTMLATGIPIIQALNIITQNHSKAEMRSILSHITKQIESGHALSETLRSASPLFDSLYVDLVATGEQSGNLAEVFARIANYREKSEQLSAKVVKALIYPTMVILTALSVAYLMLTKVIPQFKDMFNSFGAQLPWFTRQVLFLSDFAQAYAGMGLMLLAVIFFMLRVILSKSRRAQLTLSRITLKVPVLGKIITKASIAKFSRTLATSFNAGIPILAGLKASAKTAQSKHYQNALERVLLDTTAGMPLYVALRHTHCFPEMVLQMVMIGEESGRLGEMLHKIADVYEFEIDNTVDNLGRILEPILIIFLGVIVGGLVVAMYLPIFNLMSVLG